MKLLLAEMLSPVIARELRARGYDVETVAGHPEREALSDPEVLALARAERRAVVTNNIRDFRPLHVEAVMPSGTGHYGMIFMPGDYRRTKSDIGATWPPRPGRSVFWSATTRLWCGRVREHLRGTAPGWRWPERPATGRQRWPARCDYTRTWS